MEATVSKKVINSRAKGAAAERELAALLKSELGETLDIKRNLEQTRNGGYDLVGVTGWAIEVKRYAQATPALKQGWWEQAVAQAQCDNIRPVLFYREDRREWSAVMFLRDINADLGGDWTVEMGLGAWCLLARERM